MYDYKNLPQFFLSFAVMIKFSFFANKIYKIFVVLIEFTKYQSVFNKNTRDFYFLLKTCFLFTIILFFNLIAIKQQHTDTSIKCKQFFGKKGEVGAKTDVATYETIFFLIFLQFIKKSGRLF